jgi:hypothetical protein
LRLDDMELPQNDYVTDKHQNDDEREAQNQAWANLEAQSIHLSASVLPVESCYYP